MSNSAEKTAKIAKKIAKTCKKGDNLLLFGDLGAGKTVFAKGFISAFLKKQNVVSPTFTIVNTYGEKNPIYHFDLYRINDIRELDEIGFFDYVYGNGICLIEWPERLMGVNLKNTIKVQILKIDDETREIIVEKN
ncbi:MAG: tRNA (adenosine(37)-N6)-threonylcarbamoyltransferase complex ATPase subunit type 1 TsaE [Clostridia bacterium]|nr:tRNA (adenosine(37)-N6)-threonylcarbamoyltransferase complex ATPase subunit type 1 TsaE [Clostridia bacterium]